MNDESTISTILDLLTKMLPCMELHKHLK